MSLDGRELGTLELAVERSDGRPYTGELRLFLGHGAYRPEASAVEQDFHGAQVVCWRAPYVMPCAHTYFVEFPASHGAWRSVDVPRGAKVEGAARLR